MAPRICLIGLVCFAINSSVHARENVPTGLDKKQHGNRVTELCTEPTAQIDLKINNVRARVFSGGDMWWDLNEGAGTAQYEIPRGSGKTSLFAGSIWIGGYDGTNNLKVAGQTYRQSGDNEFYTGPISVQGGNLVTDKVNCDKYDRIWSVTKQEVNTFLATGVATKDIREWPGNGDESRGELRYLAPFADVNGDEVYNSEDGDYPNYLLNGQYPPDPNNPGKLLCDGYIYGDQTLFWVFNDIGNVKTETNSPPIGIEVRSQAFAFTTDDEINNMTFYKYQIINRSNLSFSQTYIGWWVDADLGDAFDDYVGCDVGLGLGYCYNGDNDDGTGDPVAYGIDPPAVGADFFQGPLADAFDGIDNDLDGDTDEVAEQIIMSKFAYYDNINTSDYGNPTVMDDYYQYLTGYWKNGVQWTRDGINGRTPPDPNNPVTSYHFPGTSDPNFPNFPNWTEATANNTPNDRRFIQSAGAFTLQPGAVNYVTVGMVWARAASGGNLASVDLLKSADAKAQGLFDNCFKTLDGPDAPDVQITELENKVILSLKNFNNPKIEKYSQVDPSISALAQPDENLRKYNFQGYLIFQVSGPTIGPADIFDPSKTTAQDIFQGDEYKLIYQVDLKDSISKIINHYWSEETQNYRDYIVAFDDKRLSGVNSGLKHSFEITTDAFTSKPLINHKSYYYLVVSYAYNNYSAFQNIVPSSANQTQQKPLKVGRNNIKIMSAIPHAPQAEFNGLIFNSEVGDRVTVQRLEGQGNAGLYTNMPDEEVDKALNDPYINLTPVYELGKGPLNVSVYDPLYVQQGNFDFKLSGVSDQSTWTVKEENTNSLDNSTFTISQPNSQIIQTIEQVSSNPNTYEWGLTADIANNVIEAGTSSMENNNGFLGSEIVYDDDNAQWLGGIKDSDGDLLAAENWIRQEDYPGKDDNKAYNDVIGGTWTAYKLANKSNASFGPKFPTNPAAADDGVAKMAGPTGLFSVDVVFTNDKSKWSRCAVLELGSDVTKTENGAPRFSIRKHDSVDKNGKTVAEGGISDINNPEAADYIGATGMGWFPGYAVNIETGERVNMVFGENSELTDDNGRDMKWNPTSRVRIDDNGTSKVIFGGMHYVYVLNARTTTGNNDIPRYDNGQKFYSILNSTVNKNNLFGNILWTTIPLLKEGQELLSNEVRVKIRVARLYRSFNTNFDQSSYVNVTGDGELTRGTSYFVISGTVVPYYNGISYAAGATFTIPTDELLSDSVNSTSGVVLAPSANGGYPHYSFNTNGLVPTKGDVTTARGALDKINIVPNPYYAYSSYDKATNQMWAKITNLPSKCVVSIFTPNGTLIRRFNRDAPESVISGEQVGLSEGTESGSGNYDTSIDWDLKNQKNIPISSGLYLIHIEAPGLGEKTLKWFGVMRPISLDSY